MEAVQTYLNGIQSSGKRAYAENYLDWFVKRGRPEPRGRDNLIGESAAKDVQSRIWRMYRMGVL